MYFGIAGGKSDTGGKHHIPMICMKKLKTLAKRGNVYQLHNNNIWTVSIEVKVHL